MPSMGRMPSHLEIMAEREQQRKLRELKKTQRIALNLKFGIGTFAPLIALPLTMLALGIIYINMEQIGYIPAFALKLLAILVICAANTLFANKYSKKHYLAGVWSDISLFAAASSLSIMVALVIIYALFFALSNVPIFVILAVIAIGVFVMCATFFVAVKIKSKFRGRVAVSKDKS